MKEKGPSINSAKRVLYASNISEMYLLFLSSEIDIKNMGGLVSQQTRHGCQPHVHGIYRIVINVNNEDLEDEQPIKIHK